MDEVLSSPFVSFTRAVIRSLSQPLLSDCWVVNTIIIADCTRDKFLLFVCISLLIL